MENIVFSKTSLYIRSGIVGASTIVGILFNGISLSFFVMYVKFNYFVMVFGKPKRVFYSTLSGAVYKETIASLQKEYKLFRRRDFQPHGLRKQR